MIYMIQTIVYTSVLLLIYRIFLRDRPLHRFNRAYLLISAVLPLLLPFMKFIPEAVAEKYRGSLFNIRIPEIEISGSAGAQQASMVAGWLLAVYIAGVVLTAFFHLRSLVRLRGVIRNSEQRRGVDHTLLLNTGYGPGSWAQYIFLPGQIIDERILQHERAHVLLRHSWDMVALMALQCCFWFNPFLYLLKRELRLVHEYQADSSAAGNGAGYRELLLSSIFDTCRLPFTHTFFHHPIKRRIMMLNKPKGRFPSLMGKLCAMAAVVVFLAGAVTVQSCSGKKWDVKKTDTPAPTAPAAAKAVVELPAVAAEYPGGQAAMMKFIGENLKYPKEAMDKKIEGRVTVQFAVGEDGKVTDPEVMRSPDPALSEAALNVVKLMPAWSPAENEKGEKVSVRYTLPVSFKL